MKALALLTPIALAGCLATVSDDHVGVVHAFNGDTVTIRGGYPADGPARPNSMMISQAKEVCSGATYLSATATPSPDDPTYLYLFRC